MATKSAKEKRGAKRTSLIVHIVLTCLLYIALILGTVYVAKSSYVFAYQVFGNDTVSKKPGTDVIVTIRKGDSTQKIAELLEYKHVIKSKNSFFIRAKLMVNSSDPILPGVYKLNSSMNYGNIIKTITDPGSNLDGD